MSERTEHLESSASPGDDGPEVRFAAALSQEQHAATPWVTLPRWWFLGILVYAPWAYGSTRPWTIDVLNLLLGLCLLFWFVGSVIERRRPALPITLLGAALFLAAQTGFMTFNAAYDYWPGLGEFSSRSQLLPGAPASLDYSRSRDVAAGAVLSLGALLFVASSGRNPIWRQRLLWTMAATGTSLVLFGLIQRLLNAPAIFWQAEDTGRTFFATYRYHSNAGSFINMVWPLLTGLLLTSVRRAQPLKVKLFWASCLTLCLAGLAVTGARAAGVIASIFALYWLGSTVLHLRRGALPPISLPAAVVGGLLIAMIVITAAATAGLDVSARRWNKTQEIFSSSNARLLVDDACLKMLPEAGWFGFGPGTFRVAFPHFTHYLGDRVSGIWLDAHQDYLQSIIEWGYLGTAAFAICIGGGLLAGLRHRSKSFSERTLTWAIASGVLMTLFHALVDFPLQIASLQLYFATLLGLLWTQPKRGCSGP